jgi:hypothetical protein
MKPRLLATAKNHLDFALVEKYPLRFSKAKGRRVQCLSGMVWITVYNELPDYMLMPGEVFAIPNNGLCVVEAIDHCQVRIDLPNLAGHIMHRLLALCERSRLAGALRKLRGNGALFFKAVTRMG